MSTLCGFGVSNYYNKLKLILLEKQLPFSVRLVYPWQRDAFADSSPLGKIPFIETEYVACPNHISSSTISKTGFPSIHCIPPISSRAPSAAN